MSVTFDLIVTANSAVFTAELRLVDSGGSQIGHQHIDFKKLQASMVEGLFDLHGFVGRYAAGPGEPGRNAAQLVADIEAVIPPIPTRARKLPYDHARYRQRNRIERFFNKVKHFRRIATRYDKLGKTFFAALCIVSAFILIRNS